MERGNWEYHTYIGYNTGEKYYVRSSMDYILIFQFRMWMVIGALVLVVAYNA